MPFYANKGYHPNLMVHPERDLASAHAHDFASTCARNFVTDLNQLHHELKQHIADAQHCYQHLADSRHSLAPEFKDRKSVV